LPVRTTCSTEKEGKSTLKEVSKPQIIVSETGPITITGGKWTTIEKDCRGYYWL
jgi:glycerol-3-phosphate dehydrogenase